MRYRRWPSYGVWLRTQQALRAGFSGYWEGELRDLLRPLRLLEEAEAWERLGTAPPPRGDWSRGRVHHDFLMTLVSRPDISSEP